MTHVSPGPWLRLTALLAAAGWADANHDGILDRAGTEIHKIIDWTDNAAVKKADANGVARMFRKVASAAFRSPRSGWTPCRLIPTSP